MSTWYFKIRWYYADTRNFKDSTCLRTIWRCYGISLYFTDSIINGKFFVSLPHTLKLLVFQEFTCIYLSTNIQAVHVGCKLSIYQIHTGNPGLERASRGLGGLLVWNLADFLVSGFQKGFFGNCKTQGFRTRQGIDERTMKWQWRMMKLVCRVCHEQRALGSMTSHQ